MDLDVAARMAREAMDDYGLSDWTFAYDHARRRAGVTKFDSKTISLSKILVPLYTRSQVINVVLHEIAHALVGPNHHHDAVWKRQAAAIGADPSARLSEVPEPPAPWVGVCPNGHEYKRFRKPRTKGSCSKCSNRYDPRYAISWRKVG